MASVLDELGELKRESVLNAPDTTSKVDEDKKLQIEWKRASVSPDAIADGDGINLPGFAFDPSTGQYTYSDAVENRLAGFDAFEVPHPEQALETDPDQIGRNERKIARQRIALAQRRGVPYWEISNEDIFAEGAAGTQRVIEALPTDEEGNIQLEFRQIDRGFYGRPLTEIRHPETGEILNQSLNTPENNANFGRFDPAAVLNQIQNLDTSSLNIDDPSSNILLDTASVIGSGAVGVVEFAVDTLIGAPIEFATRSGSRQTSNILEKLESGEQLSPTERVYANTLNFLSEKSTIENVEAGRLIVRNEFDKLARSIKTDQAARSQQNLIEDFTQTWDDSNSASDVVKGFLVDLWENPEGTLLYVAESLPFMLAAASQTTRVPFAIAFTGENYRAAETLYKERFGGVPDPAEKALMLLGSAFIAALNSAAAQYVTGTALASNMTTRLMNTSVGNYLQTAAPKLGVSLNQREANSLAGFLLNSGKKVANTALNISSRGVTELAQEGSEGLITSASVTRSLDFTDDELKDAAISGAIGFASGTGIGGPAIAVSSARDLGRDVVTYRTGDTTNLPSQNITQRFIDQNNLTDIEYEGEIPDNYDPIGIVSQDKANENNFDTTDLNTVLERVRHYKNALKVIDIPANAIGQSGREIEELSASEKQVLAIQFDIGQGIEGLQTIAEGLAAEQVQTTEDSKPILDRVLGSEGVPVILNEENITPLRAAYEKNKDKYTPAEQAYLEAIFTGALNIQKLVANISASSEGVSGVRNEITQDGQRFLRTLAAAAQLENTELFNRTIGQLDNLIASQQSKLPQGHPARTLNVADHADPIRSPRLQAVVADEVLFLEEVKRQGIEIRGRLENPALVTAAAAAVPEVEPAPAAEDSLDLETVSDVDTTEDILPEISEPGPEATPEAEASVEAERIQLLDRLRTNRQKFADITATINRSQGRVTDKQGKAIAAIRADNRKISNRLRELGMTTAEIKKQTLPTQSKRDQSILGNTTAADRRAREAQTPVTPPVRAAAELPSAEEQPPTIIEEITENPNISTDVEFAPGRVDPGVVPRNVSEDFDSRPIEDLNPLFIQPDLWRSFNRFRTAVKELAPDVAITGRALQAIYNRAAEYSKLNLGKARIKGTGRNPTVTTPQGKKILARVFLNDLGKNPAMGLLQEQRIDGELVRTLPQRVVAAMSISAALWIKENGRNTLFADDNDVERMFGIDKVEITDEHRDTVNENGLYYKMIADSIGQRVYQTLGLKEKDDAAHGARERMVHALGSLTLNMMEHNGEITVNSIERAELHDILYGKERKVEKNEDKSVLFVRVNTKEGTRDFTEQVEEIIEPYGNTKTGNTLFGIETEEHGALEEPSTTVSMTRESTLDRISTEQEGFIKKAQATAYRLNAAASVLTSLSDDFLRGLLGYVDPANAHVDRKNNIEGKNQQVLNSIDALRNMVTDFAEKPFFFEFRAGGSRRLFLRSNTFNPQQDTLHRFSVYFPDSNNTIDPNNAKQADQFTAAFNAALDIADEKVEIEQQREVFEKYLEDNSEAIEQFATAVENNDTAQMESLSLGLMGDSPSAHGFYALIELTKFREGKEFENHLLQETDGVTNGIAIGAHQLVHSLRTEAPNWLARVGVFVQKAFPGGTTFQRWKAEGNADSYETLAGAFIGIVRADVAENPDSTLGAIVNTLGIDFTSEDISKPLRELFKSPLMIFGYGAGIRNITNTVATHIYDELIDDLEKVHTGEEKNGQVLTMADMDKRVSALLGRKINLDRIGGALNASLKPHRRAIINSITEAIRDPLKLALNESLKGFSETRSLLNWAFQLQFQVFDDNYNKNLARITKGQKVVTRAHVTQAVKESLDVLPAFRGAMGQEIAVIKRETTYDQDLQNTLVQVKFEERTRRDTESTTSHAALKAFTDAGVAGVVNVIHSLDSTIQMRAIAESSHNVLNVFDAGVSSLQESEAYVKAYNKHFNNVMQEYNIFDDIIEMLTDTNDTPALNRWLQDPKNRVGVFIKGKFIPKYKTVTEFKNDLIDNRNRNKEFKKFLYARNIVVEQMVHPLGEGQYLHRGKDDGTSSEDGTRLPRTPDTTGEEDTQEADTEREPVQEQVTKPGPVPGDDGLFSESQINLEDFEQITPTPVTSRNIRTIFETLASTNASRVTSEFGVHLRTLLDQVITRGIEPFDNLILKLKEGQDKNEGQISGSTIYMNTTHRSRTHAEHSSEEVFVHELVHAISAGALNHKSPHYRPDIQAKIRRLFEQAQKELDWRIFLRKDASGNPVYLNDRASEEAQAQKMWDYVFNQGPSRNLANEEVDNTYHEFLAYGLTNQDMFNALRGVSTRSSARVEAEGAIDTLFAIIEDIFLWLVDLLANPTSAQNAQDELFKIAQSIVSVEVSQALNALNIADKALDTGLKPIANTVGYAAEKTAQMIKALNLGGRENRGILGILGNTADTAANLTLYKVRSTENGREVIREAAEGVVEDIYNPDSFIGENVISPFLTRSRKYQEWHKLLRYSKKYIDQLRKTVSVSVNRSVNEGFISPITKVENASLTRALLQTDIVSILDSYSLQQVARLLTDRNYLKGEIRTARTALLRGMPMAQSNMVNNQMSGMASYMINGETRTYNQHLNAFSLAHEIGNVELAPRIDTIVTLLALDHLDQTVRDTAATVINREFAANAQENGVINVTELAKGFRRASKQRLFGGNLMQTQKGYISEIYDPAVDAQIAPVSDADHMKAKGYHLVEELRDDDTAPTGARKGFYVASNNPNIQRIKTIASINELQVKGTTLAEASKAAGESYSSITNALQIRHTAQEYQRRSQAGTLAQDKRLIPVRNEAGKIVNYRYVMSESLRDEYLKKNYDLGNVLGQMHASIESKMNTKKINNQLIDLLKADYDENFTANPSRFVTMNADPDNEYSETFRLLPADMRAHAAREFGPGNGIPVRKEMMNIAFGYRKASLSNLSLVKDTYVGHVIKVVEQGWQELIAQEKVNIVIKSINVMVDNIISNTILLRVLGVPIRDIIKDTKEATVAMNQYQKDFEQFIVLNKRFKADPSLKNNKAFVAKLSRTRTDIESSPVKHFIDEGIFQSITEDLDLDAYGNKGRMLNWMEDTIGKHIPKPGKDFLEMAWMTENTQAFKFLLKTTQYSDFTARYVMYKHEKRVNPQRAEQDVLTDVVDTFINYEFPDNKYLQYMNDMGLFMFTKFFLRIQSVITRMFDKKTANAIASLAAQQALGNISDISDSSIIARGIIPPIHGDVVEHMWQGLMPAGLVVVQDYVF